MQIEVGKFYRRADGSKAGPAKSDGSSLFKWNVPNGYGHEHRYHDDGSSSADPKYNLIAEWIEELPHGHARLADGRVIDLTNPHGTAFGLMDVVYGPGAQEAMLEHGGPYEWFDGTEWTDCIIHDGAPELAYRIAPLPLAPKVETVTIEPWEVITDAPSGHRITFDLIDGKPDCASIRMEPL